MKRVFISAYGCEPDKGSEPGVGWNWALEIAKKNKVTVLTRKNNKKSIENYLSYFPQSNLEFLYYDLPDGITRLKKGQKGIQLYYTLWQIGAYRFAKKIFEDQKYDIVFAVTFGTMWLPTLMYKLPAEFIWGPLGGGEGVSIHLWNRLTKKQLVFEMVRAINKKLPITNPWFFAACRHAKVLIIRTEDSLNCISPKYREKCKMMIETGVSTADCERVACIGIDKKTDFTISGRLVGLKFVDIGIRAMKKVVAKYPHSVLTIVGSGECEKALKALVSDLNLNNNVVFTGALTQEASIQKIKSCKAFVMTSAKEGGAWVLFEAMMAKKPIICMDTSGMHEIVDAKAGIKISVEDYDTMVNRFADAMLFVLNHPEEATRMGENGYQVVTNHWRWEIKGTFFEKIIDEL